MVAVALLTPVASQARYIIEFEQIANLGVAEGQRVMPVAVTVDATGGEICVTDTRQVSFHLLNSHEVPVFHSSRLARLSYPADGSVDADGRIVFTDRTGGRSTIRRLNGFGEPDDYEPESPAADWNPHHLLVARNGDYVTFDTRSNLLARHDAETGALLWDRYVGLEGMSGEQVGRPAEAPDGRLFVPGGDLRKVMVLDADGRYVSAFGRFGSAPGRITFPAGVAFGPTGEVLVLDRLRAKVLIYDANLEFVSEFGRLGFRPGQLYHPVSIATTSEGRIYVAQGFEGRVQVFQMTEYIEP